MSARLVNDAGHLREDHPGKSFELGVGATSRLADCAEKGPATPFVPDRMVLKSDLDFGVIYHWGRAASEGMAW